MRDCPQQVSTKLFILRQNSRFLLLLGIFDVFQRQCALAQNREEYAVFERVQRNTVHRNTSHSIYMLVDPNRKV